MDVVHSCRCCLRRAPDKDLMTPHTHLGTTEIYSEMLQECFGIHLILDSDEEVGICDVCVGRLRDASNFKLQVQHSQEELQARLQGALQVKAIKEETPAVESIMEDGDWTSKEHVLCAEVPIKVELRNEDEISDGERPVLLDEEHAVKAEVSDDASSDEDCIPPAWAGAAYSRAPSRHGPRLASRMKDMPDDTAGLRAEEQAYTCGTCEEHFTDKSRLIDHVQAHVTQAEQLCVTYSCKTCSKEFSCINIYRKHVDTHMNSEPYTCDMRYPCEICHKTFSYRSDLKQHMAIHTGKKLYSCDRCNRNFTRSDNLDTHKRTHTGVKPYSCNECDKQFSQKHHLDRHKLIHTGEKLYSCNECDKQFTRMHNLNTHIRIHTGEKPYACIECNKRFRSRADLNMHARSHTGVKPYSCNECDKHFAKKQALNKHKRIHAGV